MPFSRLCLVAPLLLAAPILHAEPGVVITLESVKSRVQSDNPALAAARLRLSEASGRMVQAGRLDNPEFGAALEHNPDFGERRAELTLSQRFPVTNRLALEKQVSRTLLEAAEAEVREVERRLVADARRAVVEVLAIRGRSELLGQQVGLAGELAASLKAAADRGEGSALDAGLARLEAAGLDAERRGLSAAEAAAVGELRPLLGLPPDAVVHIGGTLGPAVPPAGAVDPRRRPDFQAARLDAVAAGQRVALEEAKRRGDVEAGVMVAVERAEDAPEGYERDAFVGLSFRIPLPFWDRNEGAIAEARARHEREQLEAVALAAEIHHEAAAARDEMAEWARLAAELERELLPLAAEQAQLAEGAYRAGQGDLQAVFRAREKRLSLAAARLDALRQFHLARVRYEAAGNQP